jgi:hypothetical protein
LVAECAKLDAQMLPLLAPIQPKMYAISTVTIVNNERGVARTALLRRIARKKHALGFEADWRGGLEGDLIADRRISE